MVRAGVGFMKFLSRSIAIACAVSVALLGLFVQPAHAAPSLGQACTPASDAHVTATQSADGSQATYTVTNASPLCEPLAIGLAGYLKQAAGFVVPQTLFDSATSTITSGTTTLTITVPTTGKKPHCFTQIDAFNGPVLPAITETARYGDRLLSSLLGEVATCEDVESTAVTTPTTTTTTTTAPPTTTAVQPTQVLGVEVERAPAAAERVDSGILPRTGPQLDVNPLIALAGVLLSIGGALIALTGRIRPSDARR